MLIVINLLKFLTLPPSHTVHFPNLNQSQKSKTLVPISEPLNLTYTSPESDTQKILQTLPHVRLIYVYIIISYVTVLGVFLDSTLHFVERRFGESEPFPQKINFRENYPTRGCIDVKIGNISGERKTHTNQSRAGFTDVTRRSVTSTA